MKIYSGNKIKVPTNYDFLFSKKYVTRAGIIPYMMVGDQTYILLGVDKSNGQLADLGGTIEKGETTLDAGIREYMEESRDVFPVNLKDTTSIVISKLFHKSNDKKTKQVILFVKVDYDPSHWAIDDKFQQTVPTIPCEDEMSNLQWINLKDFMNLSNSELSKSMKSMRKVLYQYES